LFSISAQAQIDPSKEGVVPDWRKKTQLFVKNFLPVDYQFIFFELRFWLNTQPHIGSIDGISFEKGTNNPSKGMISVATLQSVITMERAMIRFFLEFLLLLVTSQLTSCAQPSQPLEGVHLTVVLEHVSLLLCFYS
jgi:hypothetical protein